MYNNTYQRTFWADVYEIDELIKTMEDISSDDKRRLESYTHEEVALEAEYVLSTFYESGHINNSSYIGEHGEDEYHWAVNEVEKLKAFLKKFEGRNRA
jgi:NDP-sugar pyrophosphorylase family protein